ncbi:MAG TPA: protein-L-isoaspartate(D-aspartate) O-methyltransferase [Nitratifractor salsuginis]|uniref:Protein-L-isoaspartate O-methyltransferase n=1 Tax=Nitratifractor salsuginis TaxID=269261 RepID=A0A7V2SKP6_9BACT|nr:protein-L-isoaspartate(D-aspartate) O-methyltransferase [Nitratifractor salsuginis]
MVKQLHLKKMVEEIDARFPLQPWVRDAFLSVDREAFVPPGFRHLSYTLDALPMQAQQWISSPLTVAKMTQHLELEGVDSVLEIGCGSGYQAAILARIVRRVFTIERIEPLLREARERFRALGMSNIFTRYDDGQRGWKEYAPFERILFSATADEIPQVLFDQLADGGILLAPVNEGGLQILTRYYKRNGRITSEAIEPCLFVPVLDGTQR